MGICSWFLESFLLGMRLSTKARYYFIKTSDICFLLRFWHPNTEILNDSGYVIICQTIHNFLVQKLLSGLQQKRQGIPTLQSSRVLTFENYEILREELSSSHPSESTDQAVNNGLLGKVLKVKDTLTKARRMTSFSHVAEKTAQKLTWQWKITILNRRHLFQGLFFHCHFWVFWGMKYYYSYHTWMVWDLWHVNLPKKKTTPQTRGFWIFCKIPKINSSFLFKSIQGVILWHQCKPCTGTWYVVLGRGSWYPTFSWAHEDVSYSLKDRKG